MRPNTIHFDPKELAGFVCGVTAQQPTLAERDRLRAAAFMLERKRQKPNRGAPTTLRSKRHIAQPTDLATRVWLTRVEAATYLRISARTFDRRRRDGKYPPSGQSSSRRPLWSPKDLDESAAGANRSIDPIMRLIDAED